MFNVARKRQRVFVLGISFQSEVSNSFNMYDVWIQESWRNEGTVLVYRV